MGNSYSIQSKKLKEKTEPSCSKPFFRQKSLEYTQSDESFLYGGIWEKRQTEEEVFGSICSALKETVFDKDPIGKRPSITECEEDHYDQINESEIKSTPEKEKVKMKPSHPNERPLPPLPQASNPSETEHYKNDSIQINPNIEGVDISEMVEIFEPLIVNNLLVHEVLPYLSFLENHYDLYEEVKKCSEKVAATSLLQALHRSTEPEKWLKFIYALNTCGYTYIVKNIRGYTFVNHPYQKRYLRTITPKLSKMIDPTDLIPYLLAENLISDNDKENIQREKANFGDIEAAVLLLDRITRKHEDWYTLFVKVLRKAGRDDIAADLMIPRLLQNPRRKDRDTSWLPKMTESSPIDSLFEKEGWLLSSTSTGLYGHHKQRTQETARFSDWLPTMTESSSTYSLKEIEDRLSCSTPTSLEDIYYDEDEYALPPAPLPTATSENSSQSSNVELPTQRSEVEYDSPKALAAFCTEAESALSEKLYNLYPEPVADQVKSKPPIPPRKPYKKECPIPLQIMHNSGNDQRKQLYRAFLQSVKCSQDQNDDKNYETYEDIITSPNETIVDDADTSRLQPCLNDIEKLEMENKNINLENDHLVRKSKLMENINKGLRKQRELQNEIAMKEKEKQALQSGYDCQNYTNVPVPDDYTDKYYPTGTKANDKRKIHEPSVITRTWTKRIFDYRPLVHSEHSRNSELALMTPYSPPSMVQLFSPNFGMRSIISQRFELDSGIGAEIVNTDSEYH